MRIGFDAKRLFHNNTGLGNYSRNLLSMLIHFYPDTVYFLYNPKQKSKFRTEELIENTIEINPNSFFSKKFKALWRLFWVKNVIKRNKLKIYHGLSGEIPVGLPKNIKTIVTIHDLIFIRSPKLYSFIDRKIHYYKFKYAVKKSDVVVAITEQTKNDIIQFYKIEPQKIKIIYQGCHSIYKKNFNQQEKQQVLDKYKLPSEFLLNVGTIETRKNIGLVIKALIDTKIPLVIVGKKTDYYKELLITINKNNLQNQIYFLSNVSLNELAILYQTAKIFVYPSLFEGFGIPIIEALYSKTPVITSTGSCFSEAGGPNSIYVNPDDVKMMHNAITNLWNDSEKREDMKALGLKFVQKFNDDCIAKEWIQLYESLDC